MREAKYVILGNSVALRGIDAGCFVNSIGPCINMGLSSADIASYYSTVDVLQRLGADTQTQTALVVVYQDMFKPWTSHEVESGSRLPTTFEGMMHLLRYDAAPLAVALKRWLSNLLDMSLYRLYPRPIQATALRHTILGQLPKPSENPELFKETDSNLCNCDSEILPYHYRSWWVENHRCASGSEPSFPTRERVSDYRYYQRNDPEGIPEEYPYVGYAEVLSYLVHQFNDVWLIVFPDKYGYSDLDAFNASMRALAESSSVNLMLLTDVYVESLFYDEHHARPEGMEVLTQLILKRMSEGVAQF